MADPALPAEAVAIVGMACVLPGAPDLDTFAGNLFAGVDAISDVPPGRWDPLFYDPDRSGPDRFYCRRGGFVDDVADFDPAAFGIMPTAVEGAEPDQLLALAVAARALADAGDPHRRVAPERVGVIVGRGGYTGSGVRRLEQRVHTAEQLVVSLRSLLPALGDDQLNAVKAEFVARLGPDRPESAIDLVPNLTASRISNRLDLRGPSHTVDAACASSLIAVDQAMDQLASRRCDVVIAGGVHHCHDLTLWSVFTQLGAISRQAQVRAFDRRADGLLIGEGTALLVLKRLADAEAEGDRVYAVIRGAGVASDGKATSLMSPSSDGQVLAVERAWRRAGLDPASVGLIEAHGTGTPTGDSVELRTLQRVFGGPDGERAGLGSVKSMIGHAMPAAGAAGIVKAALAVWSGRLPPTLHAEQPSPLVDETRFRLVGSAEPWTAVSPLVAGVDAFGFGGINAHVVLEEHLPSTGRVPSRRRPPRRSGQADEQVLLASGSDASHVAARLSRLAASDLLSFDAAPAGPRILSEPTDDLNGPCRLAIVAPTPKRLALAGSIASGGRPFAGRNDVWFQPEPLAGSGGGQVAFLFPGLEPDFAPRLDDVASALDFDGRRIVGGSDRIEVLGPAVIDAGRLLHLALDRLGVRPDLVAGHSVGEWTAQIAAGMTPIEALEPLLDQLTPGRLRHPDVAFLALGCPAETAAELIAGVADVVVSHDNCPHQSVVCGTDTAVAEVTARAGSQRVLAQQLPFRSGFHTPMFEPYLDGMRELFGGLPIRPPSVPVWSATTGAPYPTDPAAVRALTIEHMTKPVGWRSLVERLHDHGTRVFVEVGVGSLVGFVGDILGDRPHLAVAAHSPKRDGLAQLRRTAAALWSAGVDVRPDAVQRLAPEASSAIGQVRAPHPAGTGQAATGTRRRLRLGRGLVHDLTPLPGGAALPTAIPAGRTGSPGAKPAAGAAGEPVARAAAAPPILAAFHATVQEAAAAASTVVEQWDRRPARRPAPAPRPPRGHAATGDPVAAAPAESRAAAWPAAGGRRELAYAERYDLGAQPAWADHAIFNQPDGWPDQSDRFPIVPLTAMIERFVDLAAELRPELTPVGLEDVRAMRWLVVAPATETTVRASVVADDRGDGVVRVRTAIDGHARATVLMAPAYPPAVPPDPRPSRRGALPWPPAAIYAERWLFHGPAYQGIEDIPGWDPTGIDGTVRALRAPGALLDNAGQVLGLWVALALDERRTVLPTTIDRIAFYSPRPPTGAAVRCRAHVTAVEDDRVVADLELIGPDGLWARIAGWAERRFDTTNPVFELIRSPQDHLVAEITTDGWAWAQESWLDPASREMIMRRYLNAPERAAYARRNPRSQRATLLGRVALKDLLRHQRWRRGAGPIFPAEITVSNDQSGRPFALGAVDADTTVSVAHSDGVGVALAGKGTHVGIDVEAVATRSDHFADQLLGPGERAVLDAMSGTRDERLTTLWTVKEAAAKAAGSGLAGRPRSWAVEERRGDRYRVGAQWVATRRLRLEPQSPAGDRAGDPNPTKEYVVAWTVNHP